MMKIFRKRVEKKMEEVSILWNTEVFQGMTRTQVIEFKKKHKKLILEQYKLNKKREALELKQASLNRKVSQAKKEILAGETNIAAGKAVKVALGGVFIATVVAGSQMSAMEKADATPNVSTYNEAVIERTVEDSTDNIAVTTISEDVVVEKEFTAIKEAIVAEEAIESAIAFEDSVVESSVEEDAIVVTEETITISEEEIVTVEDIVAEATVETPVVDSIAVPVEEIVMDDVTIENDFIIFDQALEMGMEMCENTSFNNIVMSKEFSFLDVMEKANNPIVDKWVQMLLDTNVNNKTIECNVSYIAPNGAVSFNSREGGFFADIDKSQLEVRVNINLQKMIDDSIESGVDEFTRDLLFNNEYREIESIFFQLQHEVEKELVLSGAFLEEVKNDVASKLTEYTTWEVNATLK